MAATDHGRLTEALAAHGIDQSVADIDHLLRGVLAAPEGFEPDGWLDLVAPTDATDLRALLKARLAQLGESASDRDLPIADRLDRFRLTLATLGIDGFIQPLTDEHRNEYIPAARQRLAWLTGFTGSAGTVIIMADRAVMFVDGRYTIQAEQQLDVSLFERAHLIDMPPAKWLGQNLKKGQRLGYDPQLHFKADIERLRRATDKASAELVPVQKNPVDAVWTTRPPMPIAPINTLDDAYAGESSDDKRRRMGKKVEESGAEVALISAPDSIAWLLNIRGGDVPFNPLTLAFALLHQDGGVEVFLDKRKLRPGQNLGNAVSIQSMRDLSDSLEQLGKAEKSVLIDPAWINTALTERLAAAGAKLIEGDEPCVLAKACKNPNRGRGRTQRPNPRWRRRHPLPHLAGRCDRQRSQGYRTGSGGSLGSRTQERSALSRPKF